MGTIETIAAVISGPPSAVIYRAINNYFSNVPFTTYDLHGALIAGTIGGLIGGLVVNSVVDVVIPKLTSYMEGRKQKKLTDFRLVYNNIRQ